MPVVATTRVLGIDCGTERTGFGVIETDGRRHTLLTTGVIRTSAKEPLADRLRKIADGLRHVIGVYQPAHAAVEEVFHAHNAQSALKLAHVRGVALLLLAEAGLTVGEYSPASIKMSVVGFGRAEKHQVQTMVKSLLRLSSPIESEDAADATAVAICHANTVVNGMMREASRVVATGASKAVTSRTLPRNGAEEGGQ